MHIQSAMLISDWLIWGLFFAGIIAFFWMRRVPHLREPWKQVVRKRLGMIALIILLFYIAIGLLDSIHLRITKTENGAIESTKVMTVLDILIRPLGQQYEKTYSAPFATHLYSQHIIELPGGKEIRDYPKLKYGGADNDIFIRVLIGFSIGFISLALLMFIFLFFVSHHHQISMRTFFINILKGKTAIAWREALITFSIIWLLIFTFASLSTHYHILGTGKVGQDVFYEGIKSIRTGLLIGTLTTIFMLPFALILGIVAGYFSGFIDDIIQYVYTTLSSIPGVLLISAAILVMQVYISNHPELFPTLSQRADARLLALCLILGITSWANLCRLLRAETLKIKHHEFIQAAHAMAVKNHKILFRHIMPNVMHIVLITIVLDFSGLVLAEAILSYVGVGVDPTTYSWGNMINSSRLELAREPIVWWPLISALIFMFVLVLSANIFSDAVRDAFDPYLRELKD